MLGARTSARPKLVESSGFATAARANLALEIAAKQAADEAVRQLEGAGAALREAYWAARAAVATAETAVEDSKDAASDFLIATATGTNEGAPVTTKTARANLQEAQDSAEATKVAQDRLTVRLSEAQGNSAKSADRVKAAAIAVLIGSPVVATIADDVARLQAELTDKTDTFQWLVRAGAWPTVQEPGNHYGKPVDERLRDLHAHLWMPINHWPGARAPRRHRWDEALEALLVDANAPVPEVG